MTRLLSYSIAGRATFGIMGEGGVVDLGLRMPSVADLGGLIGAGLLEEARSHEDDAADHSLDDITYERLLPWPGKIFCIGVNYCGRADEYADRSDTGYPSVFLRVPDSLTGHERGLIRPPESPQLDYEGEIVVVIGAAGRRIPIDQARRHIAGLTLGNEGTIRDWTRHAKFNVTQGKNWEATGAIGPWLVPVDEIGDLDCLHLTTRVNGELRQKDTSAAMKYSIEYQIHYLSTFTTLHPGDVIFTGTPTGAGVRSNPPIWLQPGDVVEVSVPEIGTLRNNVIDEPAISTTRWARPEPQTTLADFEDTAS